MMKSFRKTPLGSFGRNAFTLLEVIIALALFALIAVPTLGLITMSARKADNRIGIANAEQLMRLVDIQIRGTSIDIFSGTLTLSDLDLYASKDLTKIDFETTNPPDSAKYYKITVQEPANYVYDENGAYRMFLYNVIWPAWVQTSPGVYVDNENSGSQMEQVILASTIRK